MRPGRRPRQADIAEAAGVSQATVSVVLGGNRAGVRLAESTKRRVLAAAESLGYVPDPVATRLASSRNRMLGLYTFTAAFPTDVSDSYYPILVGVEQEAAALGQDLVLFTGSNGDGAKVHDHAAIQRTRIADGCLFLGRHVPTEEIESLMAGGFPVVYIGRRHELGGRIPYVGADYVTASAAVVERLVALGHRRVRYVREHDDAPSSTDRERGLRTGAAAAGLDQTGVVLRTDGRDVDAALLRGWLRDGVTAVVVEETDTGAAFEAVAAAVAEAGLSCPDDLSLAVLGRPPSRAVTNRAVTSRAVTNGVVTGFEVPRREMGRRAVRLLADLVAATDGGKDLRVHHLLPCPPVPGDTVGPPPARR
jgi:DNA-binding LacI/PurR family transcriptional regulator